MRPATVLSPCWHWVYREDPNGEWLLPQPDGFEGFGL
jgi:hypothetical protein